MHVMLHQIGLSGFVVSRSVALQARLCAPATRWVSSVVMFWLLVAICVKLIHCLKDSCGNGYQSKWPLLVTRVTSGSNS